MKIYVDADACPVISIIEEVAKIYHIPVILLCDTNHVLRSKYSNIRVIGAGADAVDFALVSQCEKGDIVVTQDYGVAAMVLGKGAYCIHQSGFRYTDENIEMKLMERHLAKAARRSSKRLRLKGPSRRSSADDQNFRDSFQNMIKEIKDSKET